VFINNNQQSRWKSPVAWSAFSVLLLTILKNYGLLEPLGLTPESYNEITTLITSVLVGFGIWNNPKDKTHV
jgi:hypothetical protein